MAASIDGVAILRRIRSGGRTLWDAEAIADLARLQHGVVSRKQLLIAGLGRATIARWLDAARLHRIHPGVYAVGHAALSLDGRLFAALLYGGDHAVLSHTTAAWVWALIEAEPRRIHLTVPGRRSSSPGVRVHHSRRVERTACRGLPLTPIGRTLLDLASMVTPRQLRRAVAEADFRGRLDLAEIQPLLGKGRPGAAALRAALDRHLPQFARTLSELENRFLELCRSARLPLPEVNGRVGALRVDALWREQRLAIELDGGPAHAGPAAMKRDRRRELALRSAGFRVVRHSWDQIVELPGDVLVDLRRLLFA